MTDEQVQEMQELSVAWWTESMASQLIQEVKRARRREQRLADHIDSLRRIINSIHTNIDAPVAEQHVSE